MIPSQAYIIPGTYINIYKEYNIIEDVCKYFNISKNELISKSRERRFAEPRQIAIFIIRLKFKNYQLKKIGSIFNKDHSTILHSIKVVENQMKINLKFKMMMNEIMEIINNKILKTIV